MSDGFSFWASREYLVECIGPLLLHILLWFAQRCIINSCGGGLFTQHHSASLPHHHAVRVGCAADSLSVWSPGQILGTRWDLNTPLPLPLLFWHGGPVMIMMPLPFTATTTTSPRNCTYHSHRPRLSPFSKPPHDIHPLWVCVVFIPAHLLCGMKELNN